MGGVADGHLGEPCRDRLDDGFDHRGRHDGAADGRALLPGLDRHLGDHGLDVQVELRVVGRDVRAQHRAVERVGLDPEADAAVEHVGVVAQQPGGVGGAGEGDRVLHGQLVEQPARAAAEQLQRALGQDAGLDGAAYDELGEVGGLAGGLDDRGQAGQEGGSELLEHAPDGEVEGVDLHRDARPRGPQVLADERAATPELLERSVEHDRVVGQLALALAGEGEHRADAAVDVDQGVAPGGAGAGRERVHLVLEPGQVGRELLEQGRALVEVQRPQRRTADPAGVLDHRAEVEAGAGDPRDLLAGPGVEQGSALVGGAEPASGGIALEQVGHGSSGSDRDVTDIASACACV